MESELIAGSFASVEGIWLIKLGKDFTHFFTPIPLFTDNQSFMMLTNNAVNNNRTKHIDTHFHYMREQVANGNIILHYIPMHENPTDILTKALWPQKHMDLVAKLNIVASEAPAETSNAQLSVSS